MVSRHAAARFALSGRGSALVAVVALLCSVNAVLAGRTLILSGGAVYTGNVSNRWATSIVIQGGKIAFVGDDSGTQQFRREGARVIDLTGLMVMPGFHDAHAHPMSGALRLLRCSLADDKSVQELFATIRHCASTAGSTSWLIGYGWDSSWAPQLARISLDRIVADRPAFLSDTDGYKAWANTKALAAAGIDPAGVGPQTNGIERNPKTLHPTGMLTGDATDLVRNRLPPPTEEQYREALRLAMATANRNGITSLFDAAARPAMLQAYRDADMANELTVRVVAAQVTDPRRGAAQIDEMAARRARLRGRLFRADAAKLFLDEEIPLHTAAMLDPYSDMPGSRGKLFFEPARLDELVRKLDAEGFLIHMHAMGDRAVRSGLDAIERAIAANGPRDRRHQIAHLGVTTPADVVRFGRLGVVANFQPLWFPADDPATKQTDAALGTERSRWIMPMGSIAKMGGRVVAGSDWPATPMNPLEGIQAAVTRQPANGNLPARQPQERVELTTAIAAYTSNAAWAVHEDGIDGTIERGKAADLIVLDRNIFRLNAGAIDRARVLLTLLDGRTVYRDPKFVF